MLIGACDAVTGSRRQAQASTEATHARLEGMTFDFSFGAAAPEPAPPPPQSPSFAPAPPPVDTPPAASEPAAASGVQLARRSSMDEARRKLEQRIQAETQPAVMPKDVKPPYPRLRLGFDQFTRMWAPSPCLHPPTPRPFPSPHPKSYTYTTHAVFSQCPALSAAC